MDAGEPKIGGETENLSTRHQKQGDAARPHDTLDKDDQERGQPARFDRQTGEVSGSGSNAGGAALSGEDYDQDPQGGGGQAPRSARP